MELSPYTFDTIRLEEKEKKQKQTSHTDNKRILFF